LIKLDDNLLLYI